ncbi:aminoglycoside phosphotransferase [Ophiostoma piceae UAMH 11346]|uniref:Aminoglycoside phosphotransferase n=1 Tax=Ophiostoma piceae (strain UAMH 11346) TaxID=1262450 RepID=S3C5N4_OPHP1|nr:aminoglycoside phosphotransferase [Ophiostoma piceae UAMH 11346]
MGGMHVHRALLFEDGTVWLVRMLRENYTSFDDATSNQILLSECATLSWLAACVSGVPAPRLHGYGLRGDASNAVGVAYMLIDKLPGQPFQMDAANADQKAKVLDQWANMLCALGRHPLDKVGSLQFTSDGGIIVGPVAGDRTGTLPCTLGPFADARSFYAAWADAYLDAISDSQLFSEHPVDTYLMFRWIKEQVTRAENQVGWASWTEWKALHAGPFFLRHVDDKGGHLLVDDNFNITGVIGWTFARTAPAYEAFGPALVTANTSDLFSGKPGLSEADHVLQQALSRHEAPFCCFEADSMRRLLLGVGVGLGFSFKETTDVFRCLVTTWSDGSQTVPAWHTWRAGSLSQWQNQDARLAALVPPQRPVPRFTTCAFHSGCARPSLDDHAWEQSITDEIEALLAQVNIPALESRASTLRDGIACKFRRGQHLGSEPMMGWANYHAWIEFADGVQWLVRLPRTTDGSDVPSDLVDHLVASEFATLRFVEQQMGNGTRALRAPRAHGFGVASDVDNDVGVAYLLEDALPGRPFSAYNATPEQTHHVYSQYADILAEISLHPVKQACSLVPSNSEIKEGAIASDRFFTLSQHGPYADALSFYSSVADLHLDLIADGQIFPDYPQEAFVFYRLLRDQAAPALAAPPEHTLLPGFFLKHVDDKGDHILVDGDYNITGLIDWQFARFVPAVEAFGPSILTADMGNIYKGKAGLSADDKHLAALFHEKGRDDLAKLAAGNELARRFHFGLASGLSRDEAIGMLDAVLALLHVNHSINASDWAAAEWAKAKGDSDPRWQQIEDRFTNEANLL